MAPAGLHGRIAGRADLTPRSSGRQPGAAAGGSDRTRNTQTRAHPPGAQRHDLDEPARIRYHQGRHTAVRVPGPSACVCAPRIIVAGRQVMLHGCLPSPGGSAAGDSLPVCRDCLARLSRARPGAASVARRGSGGEPRVGDAVRLPKSRGMAEYRGQERFPVELVHGCGGAGDQVAVRGMARSSAISPTPSPRPHWRSNCPSCRTSSSPSAIA
jgi:hypothetical protein